MINTNVSSCLSLAASVSVQHMLKIGDRFCAAQVSALRWGNAADAASVLQAEFGDCQCNFGCRNLTVPQCHIHQRILMILSCAQKICVSKKCKKMQKCICS